MVSTSHNLKNVLAKPKVVGRLAHISNKLGEYDMKYMPKTSIKDQALINFVIEFSDSHEITSNEDLHKVCRVGVK